ncbi:DUF4232 domain-containing protein [Catenuloplanes atrovinosus]|uniref:DUF4232 domain-containing protein n=1 Tax=Catenuloplanes atrovinosus TaxID=137266 RepID=A0AAE3YHU1_9ACTN|nr:DUF4232 domain-containing protein [Catenuloplanes atrovinosus]MDR7273680.1 hypothetical protein [Catenuloplanes atrovinosus]
MRRPLRGIVSAAVLCAVAACTSPSPAPREAPAGPAPAESAGGTVTGAPGDACTGEDITAEATVQKAGVALLTITNTSAAPCRLTGWPKLGLLAADGSALTVPVREVPQPGPATPADVAPGQSAYAGFRWTSCDKSATDCAVATTLTVAPEGGGAPVTATFTGVAGGTQTVDELPLSALTVGTLQPSPQGVVAW